jgi:alpha-L-glutamate ligase-like protein
MAIDDVLSMNCRNIEYIMNCNRREHFVLVDDKLTTKSILNKYGIASAELICQVDSFFGIDTFLETVSQRSTFVIKPARGSGGSGIVVVKRCSNATWHLSDGETWDREKQRQHIQNILYGTFSLDSTGDMAFAESLIHSHPDLDCFSQAGLPDIRVILYLGRPVASMLRVATHQSHGKANLHAGGFAVAIDMETGITGRGWHKKQYIEKHPETNAPLPGRQMPFWGETLQIAKKLFEYFPLGYMGADFAIDTDHGPLILELNARPGLEIQNVIGHGLKSILERSLV